MLQGSESSASHLAICHGLKGEGQYDVAGGGSKRYLLHGISFNDDFQQRPTLGF